MRVSWSVPGSWSKNVAGSSSGGWEWVPVDR